MRWRLSKSANGGDHGRCGYCQYVVRQRKGSHWKNPVRAVPTTEKDHTTFLCPHRPELSFHVRIIFGFERSDSRRMGNVLAEGKAFVVRCPVPCPLSVAVTCIPASRAISHEAHPPHLLVAISQSQSHNAVLILSYNKRNFDLEMLIVVFLDNMGRARGCARTVWPVPVTELFRP